MLRQIFLLPLLFITFVSFAQKETHYYDRNGKMCNEDTAMSYAVFTKSGNGFNAEEYSTKGVMQMKGFYTRIDTSLRVGRDGVFTYYHKNRSVSSTGVYKNDLLTGLWKGYSYTNGALKYEHNYKDDSLDGYSVSYNVETGTKAWEGNYVNGKKEGVWKYYHKDKHVYDETYKAGKLHGEKTIYNEKGAVIKRLAYENGKFISGHAYDDQGKAISYVMEATDTSGNSFSYVEEMPAAGYNLNKYLAKNIVYPRKERKTGVEGRVIVRFVIDEDGMVDDVVVVQKVSPRLDAEAVRVISQMPQWKPGKQNGEPVKVYFTLPINFVLED